MLPLALHAVWDGGRRVGICLFYKSRENKNKLPALHPVKTKGAFNPVVKAMEKVPGHLSASFLTCCRVHEC